MSVINSELFSAIYCGSTEKVREILNTYGLSYSYHWGNGYVLLCKALEYNKPEVVTLLLQMGCRMKTNNPNPVTHPLHYAVLNGDLEIVKMLVAKGAYINVFNTNHISPLHLAVQNINIEIVKFLLQSGADTETKNNCKAPLHVAAEKSLQMVLLLLHYKADINCVYHDDSCDNNHLFLTPLHIATMFNRVKTVELLLNRGATVDCGTEHNRTPLHIAVEKENLLIAEHLVNHGASVDCRTEHNITPLYIAVKKGNLSISKLLLNHGASPNFADDSQSYTALHLAITKRNSELVMLLLQHGASPNIPDDLKPYTALQLAITTGNSEFVTLLLQHGANINIKDKNDNTAIYLAVEKGNLSIIKQILNFHPKINDGNNKNILHIAIYGDVRIYRAIIELLLDYGFSLNPEEENNYDLLFAAAAKGYLKIVKILLDHCTDINILYDPQRSRVQEPHTLLHCATKNKHEGVAELLINYGADVNIKDQAGYPPIFYAIDNSDVKMTELLLNNRANIQYYSPILNEIPNLEEETTNLLLNKRADIRLLNIAVKKHSKEIVKILLQYGADVNAVDECGRTALYFTQFNDSKDDVKVEIVKLLLDHGAYVDAKTNKAITPLHLAVKSCHVKVIDVLLEHNANVNSKTTKGTTPLHLAVQKGNKEIITKLLDKGADINEILANRGTLLHIATQKGHKEIVKILLNYGAPVDSRMEKNISPLYIAARQGHLDIVKILLDHGADINSTNEDGATALHIASSKGHEDIVTCLIDHGCDINIVTKQNYTPIDFARDSINTELDCEYDYDDNCLSNTYERIIEILKMQIIKLKTANLFVNKRNLSLLSESMTEELRNFQKSCEKEIELMKHEKIDNDSSISFYDVLTKSELGIFAKNDNVKQSLQLYKSKCLIYNRIMIDNFFNNLFKGKQTLQTDAYKNFQIYKIYFEIMFLNFARGTKRKELLEESLDIFYSLFEISDILPYNCAENIIKFISNKDLRYFVDVGKILKTSNINNTNKLF